MKKVFIIVKDLKAKKHIKIELSDKELSAMFDFQFMAGHEAWDTAKLNKIDKDVSSFFRKLNHVVNDCLDDGVTYHIVNGKFEKSDSKFWMVKKPRWRYEHR